MMAEKHNLEDQIEDVDEDDSGELPVVLQCSQCNVILGDSLSYVSTNDELKIITLRSVSGMVVKGNQLVTSAEGVDLGSTYQQLQCKNCKDVVGRMYRTTPKSLDDLREMYTLYITKINSYQVGSAEQTEGAGDLMTDQPTAKQLQTSITKIQVMVVTLNERLLNMEKALQIEYEDDEETDTKLENDNDKVVLVSNAKGDGMPVKKFPLKRDVPEKKGPKNSLGRLTDRRQLGEINHSDEEEEEEEDDAVTNGNAKKGKHGSEGHRSRKRSRVK